MVSRFVDNVDEPSLLVEDCDCEVDVSELDVVLEEAGVLVCEGVELGVEDVKSDVELWEGVLEEDDESLVGVGDVLAGVVVEAGVVGIVLDVLEPLVIPTSDSAPETMELTSPPCRL